MYLQIIIPILSQVQTYYVSCDIIHVCSTQGAGQKKKINVNKLALENALMGSSIIGY